MSKRRMDITITGTDPKPHREHVTPPVTHGRQEGGRSTVDLPPGFVRWLLRDQFHRNCLASVAIEYPALRNDPRLNDGL